MYIYCVMPLIVDALMRSGYQTHLLPTVSDMQYQFHFIFYGNLHKVVCLMAPPPSAIEGALEMESVADTVPVPALQIKQKIDLLNIVFFDQF